MDASFWTAANLGVTLAAGGAFSLWLGIRLRIPGWGLLVLACLPVAFLLLDDDFRIWSYHGFLHTSIVYRIQADGLPPLDPLFAGRDLLYPWAHHAWVAGISSIFDWSPPAVFAAINVAALAATVFVLYSLIATLFGDRTTGILGAALGVYGLAAVPVAIVLQGLTDIELESRLVPVQKFTNTNSNSLGILCFALGLLALARLYDRSRDSTRVDLLWLAVALLAGAFLYPLTWAALVGVTLAGIAVASRVEPASRWRVPAAIVAVVVATSAVAAPYLAAILVGRSEAAAIGIELSASHLTRNLANLLLVVVGWLALAWFVRGDLRKMAGDRPGVVAVLATAAIATAGAFVTLHSAVHTEYKFLMLCGLTLSIPAALAVRKLLDRSALGCLILLWLLLLPAGAFFSQVGLGEFAGPFGISEQGRLLQTDAPDSGRFHGWIRESTPTDAVFVDLALTVPVFGQRALFVAMDPAADGPGRLRGWGLSPLAFLSEVMGHPSDLIERRRRITASLLTPSPGPLGAALAELRGDANSSSLYLVARTPETALRLRGDPRLVEKFSSASVSVYALDPAGAPRP